MVLRFDSLTQPTLHCDVYSGLPIPIFSSSIVAGLQQYVSPHYLAVLTPLCRGVPKSD